MAADPQPSLDVVLEHVKKHIDTQNAQIATLDTKASFVLGSGSLLTAGVTGFWNGVSETLGQPAQVDDRPVLLYIAVGTTIFALLFYLGLVWSAFQAYRIRPYCGITKLRELRNTYLTRPEIDTKSVLLDTQITAAEESEQAINEKVTWSKRAIAGLIGQAVLIAVMIVIVMLTNVLS